MATKVGSQTMVIIEIIKVAIKVRITTITTISRNRVATKTMHIIKGNKTHITVHNLHKLIQITNEVSKVIMDKTISMEDIITKATKVVRITKASNRTI